MVPGNSHAGDYTYTSLEDLNNGFKTRYISTETTSTYIDETPITDYTSYTSIGEFTSYRRGPVNRKERREFAAKARSKRVPKRRKRNR